MEQTSNKRRNFMKLLGIGSIGAIAATMAGRQPGHTPPATGNAEPAAAHKGYRLSEHVATYYRKARI